jgi:hypothetical protein
MAYKNLDYFDVVDGLVQASDTKKNKLKQGEVYVSSDLAIATSSAESEETELTYVTVLLTPNQDICDQIKKTIDNGTSYVVGVAEQYELFPVKTRVTMTYEIDYENIDILKIQCINPDKVDRVRFKYCSDFTHANTKFKLIRVIFEDGTNAVLDKIDWIVILPAQPVPKGQQPRPQVVKKVPNGDLSLLCKVPLNLLFKKISE